jgi:OOP family OmpA-OmpF porin
VFKRLVLAVAAAATLVTSAAIAEPLGRHFELTPFGGWTWFDGDMTYVNGSQLTDDLYFGGRLGYLFSPWLGVEVAGGLTPTTEERSANPRNIDFYHASGNLLLTPWNGRHGGPYVFGGIGTANTKISGGASTNKVSFEYGGGVRLWMSDALGVRLEARDLFYQPELASGGAKVDIHNLVVGGGITFALGATPRDTDGDGVPDKHDGCPDTPRGAKVDARGCPIDSDGDGVYDGLDQCEGTPKGATVDARGCPIDSDGDGVFDGIDQCPDTPKGAKVDAKGCPLDSDGDGVFDGLDQCENTPKGCTIDDKGCPKDSDGDGVCDGLDTCPETSPGLKVDEHGCPIQWIERETELLDTGMIRLQNIQFETNKADLKPEALPLLDVVGQVLEKWPQLRIEIGGHTDARGSDAHNQKLSEARANAVEKYLLEKFPTLDPKQFTVKGYGESRPLVPNRDETSWALNRRVEFVVQNKDVLKREVERRRTLMKSDTTGTAPPDTTRH